MYTHPRSFTAVLSTVGLLACAGQQVDIQDADLDTQMWSGTFEDDLGAFATVDMTFWSVGDGRWEGVQSYHHTAGDLAGAEGVYAMEGTLENGFLDVVETEMLEADDVEAMGGIWCTGEMVFGMTTDAEGNGTLDAEYWPLSTCLDGAHVDLNPLPSGH